MNAKSSSTGTFLQGRACRIDLSVPRVMGILNLTPDSFYDGGRHAGVDLALRQAAQMVEEGADLLDLGGESTRPGALAVSAEEELERVVPVVRALRRELDIPLSIDTTKSSVAEAALAEGAHFINDVSAMEFDPAMAAVIAGAGAGVFLMHTRGTPETMQHDIRYRDLIAEVMGYLELGARRALDAGIGTESICLDPGIGFGKSLEGNLAILRNLSRLGALGYPLLLGTSRKSFIGKILGLDDPQDRLFGSVSTVALAVAQGTKIFRVHDVRATREAALMAAAVCHC